MIRELVRIKVFASVIKQSNSGHVSSTYVERLKGISLVVRSEADGYAIVFNHPLLM